MRRTRCFRARWLLQKLDECHMNKGLYQHLGMLWNATQTCKAFNVPNLTLFHDMADCQYDLPLTPVEFRHCKSQ